MKSWSFRSFPLWLIPLLLAIIWLPIKGTVTSSDPSWYMSYALNISRGLGYVDVDQISAVTNRGPIFPYLIAVSFSLFGPTVEHALWVVRLFFVLNTMLLYAMGTLLYNRWVGLLASVLMLTSFAMNQWQSVVFADSVVAFFIVLYVLLLLLAFKRNQIYLFALSGVTIGVAFLTKQVAVPFFALPILGLLLYFRQIDRRMLRGLDFLYAVAFLMTGAWLYFNYRESGGFRIGGEFVGESLVAAGKNETGGFDLIRAIQNYGTNISEYYTHQILGSFFFAPFFLISWFSQLIYGLFRKNRTDIYLTGACLLYLPFIVYVGDNDWQLRHSFSLLMLVLVIVARVVILAAQSLLVLVNGAIVPEKWQSTVTSIALAVVVVSMGLLQVRFDPGSMLTLWKGESDGAPARGYRTYGMSYYGGSEFIADGWHGSTVTNAGMWLRDKIPPDAVLVGDWEWLPSLYFVNGGRNPFIMLAAYVSSADPPPTEAREGERVRPLFVWQQSNSELEAFDETSFLAQLVASKAGYVIVNARRNYLSLYLDAHPGFERVRSWNKGRLKVYKVVNPTALDSFATMVDANVVTELQKADKNSARYGQWRVGFLEQTLGLTETAIDDLEAGRSPTFAPDAVYP